MHERALLGEFGVGQVVEASMVAREQRLQAQLIRCQYLYFCTGKAGTFVLASKYAMVAREQRLRAQLLTCQYLYFCTSKASKSRHLQ